MERDGAVEKGFELARRIEAARRVAQINGVPMVGEVSISDVVCGVERERYEFSAADAIRAHGVGVSL